MQAWLENIAGPEYASALMWTIFILIGLLVVLILVRIVRGMTFGTFVAGGRNRRARLAVMDATAVDSHRRLVLVRRDDVEHLILIGGPTDVVVEQNIGLLQPQQIVPAPLPEAAAPRHPAPEPAPSRPAAPPKPQPEPQLRQEVAPPARQEAIPPAPAPAPAPEVRVATPPPATPAKASEPVFAAAAEPTVRADIPPPAEMPAPSSPYEPQKSSAHDLDDALLQELESSLEKAPPKPASGQPSLDDEMSKLLAGISGQKNS